jgi:hypothetical protein
MHVPKLIGVAYWGSFHARDKVTGFCVGFPVFFSFPQIDHSPYAQDNFPVLCPRKTPLVSKMCLLESRCQTLITLRDSLSSRSI